MAVQRKSLPRFCVMESRLVRAFGDGACPAACRCVCDVPFASARDGEDCAPRMDESFGGSARAVMLGELTPRPHGDAPLAEKPFGPFAG